MTAHAIPATVPSSKTLRDVQGWLRRHHDDMTSDLTTYIETETPSNDKGALSAGLAWIDAYLESAIGAPDRAELVDGGEHGDIRISEYDGESELTVLVLCHYDTVWDRGTILQRPCTVDGDVLRGPGCFDMKSGLIQFAWALRAMREFGLPRPRIRLLLNGDEELGSPSSRPVIERSADGADIVFVMEPSVDGALKTSRKGVGIFTIDTHGIEAHTGLEPEKGASAIEELAHVTLHLRDLQDPDAGTTINVGKIHGGRRSNVVAGHASATVDVRAISSSEAERVETAIRSLSPVDPRVSIEIGGGWNRPVLDRTPQVAALYDAARRVGEVLGMELAEAGAGGGSDGNFLAARGLPLLDGLGAVGAGAHSTEEHVLLTPTWERVAVVVGLLGLLAGDGGDDAHAG